MDVRRLGIADARILADSYAASFNLTILTRPALSPRAGLLFVTSCLDVRIPHIVNYGEDENRKEKICLKSEGEVAKSRPQYAMTAPIFFRRSNEEKH